MEFIINKKNIFYYTFLFLNPFLIFLNQNIHKFNTNTFFIFLQLIIFFLLCIFTLSLIFFLILKKNKPFNKIFLTFLILNFFLFFHHDLKAIIPAGRFSSELALVLLSIVSILFILKINKSSILNSILFFFCHFKLFFLFFFNFNKDPIVIFNKCHKRHKFKLRNRRYKK